MYGYICVGMHVWLCMALYTYGYVWLCIRMAMYGYVWLCTVCMAMCGDVLSISTYVIEVNRVYNASCNLNHTCIVSKTIFVRKSVALNVSV